MMYKSWMFKQRSFRLQNPATGDGSENGGGASGAGDAGDAGASGTADDAGDAGDAGAGSADKPKPTDAEAKLLKEVMDKKNALRKTQAELEEVKNRLKDFEGLNAAEIRALVDERKALETRKLEEKGEWDRLKAQMADENKKVVDGVMERLSASEQRAAALVKQVAELTVGGAFSNSTYIKEDLTLPPSKARALYGANFEYNAEAGAVIGYDKPAGAAERTALVDSQGEHLSFESALKKLVDADPDREQLIKSKIKSGSGSKSSEKGKPPAVTFDQPKGIDRIAAALRAANQGK